MKLAFGKALINDAPILILDEPTNTLDLPSARELRAIVHDLNTQGRTIVYTTHLMSEAEELCDRVAIIDRGQVIALGTIPELKAVPIHPNWSSIEEIANREIERAFFGQASVDEAAASAVALTSSLFADSP